jgi:IS30 family transposase
MYVCRETIYNALYALPVGELRKDLIICLRQGNTSRRPRSGGVDCRGQIPDLVRIHVLPPEVEDRLTPGHRYAGPVGGRSDQGQGQRLSVGLCQSNLGGPNLRVHPHHEIVVLVLRKRGA